MRSGERVHAVRTLCVLALRDTAVGFALCLEQVGALGNYRSTTPPGDERHRNMAWTVFFLMVLYFITLAQSFFILSNDVILGSIRTTPVRGYS